jgi:tricarballylate dehydrogenase
MKHSTAQSINPQIDFNRVWDVLVIGGGNAALCAAMTARESGASVLVLECAPKHFRGGNSRHTRNLRYAHEKANDHLTGPYREDEFFNDLIQVTEGKTDEELARLAIRKSNDIGRWMVQHGCKFQPSMRGTLHLDRTNAFFLGGGKALMNAYYSRAEKMPGHRRRQICSRESQVSPFRLTDRGKGRRYRCGRI